VQPDELEEELLPEDELPLYEDELPPYDALPTAPKTNIIKTKIDNMFLFMVFIIVYC
jgi:hypothetical protein